MDDLVAGFKAGDENAIREIVRRHTGALQTVARSMVKSPELVAEVVQQTFVKAWRAADRFDETRELTPWLYSIARRTAIDVMRRENRPTAGAHEREVDVAVYPISFERTWEIYEVRQALDELPEEERTVVRLSYLIGLTHEQIAEQLEIPLGTVKSRSSRARRRLAVALGHLAEPANQTAVSDVQDSERQL